MKLAINFVFQGWLQKGCLRIVDHSGRLSTFGDPHSSLQATLHFHDRALPFKLMGNFVLALGEAYMDKGFTIEEGTLYDLLEILAINIKNVRKSWLDRIEEMFFPLLRLVQQHNPISLARKHVAHHYDLSERLYELFLDKDMQYSCAYFRHPNDDLETAQLQKKRHIASKLLLRPGMRVLDIGCGWGGMGLYLAKNYGVEVVGLTLSEEQLKIANERAEREDLTHKVKFYLRDYREETGEYDRIVSVGMFEHVGANYYPDFFGKVSNLLKPDGVMLLHSIGRRDVPGTTNAWLRKYIFPGGYAPAVSEVFSVIQETDLWTTDMEILRLHYAETLRHWWMRFNKNRAAVSKIYDERFCRMWEFYLNGCEVNFRYLDLMVFQIQLAKNVSAVPITRDYMLDAENRTDVRYVPQPANSSVKQAA